MKKKSTKKAVKKTATKKRVPASERMTLAGTYRLINKTVNKLGSKVATAKFYGVSTTMIYKYLGMVYEKGYLVTARCPKAFEAKFKKKYGLGR